MENNNRQYLMNASASPSADEPRSRVTVPPPTPWLRLLDAFRHYRYAVALRGRRATVPRCVSRPVNERWAGIYRDADGNPFLVRGD